MTITIDPHDGIDKSFGVKILELDLYFEVDYDDVNHTEVDAAIKMLRDILMPIQFNPIKFKEYYKEELMKTWNDNRSGLQEDYESLEDYLEQNRLE